MTNTKTAVLLIGFGGPTKPEEVRPFLESVLQGVRILPERFETVLRHYERLGGVSPYISSSYEIKKALEEWLKSKGCKLPVFVGFRHSAPSLKEAFLKLKADKVEAIVGFVLSPFRSYASYEKYQEKVEDAVQEAGFSDVRILYTEPFHRNTHFVEAQSERIKQKLIGWDQEKKDESFFVFTAHSIPAAMSEKSGYADQLAEAASAVARNLELKFWEIAYQSRSGDPSDPWLGPDVKEVIRKLNPSRFKNVILVPIGFLCENAEIIYDLDVEAGELTRSLGFHYARVATVSNHPRFIEMMGELIYHKL